MSIFRRMFNRKENNITGSGNNNRNSGAQLNNNRSNATIKKSSNSNDNYNGSSGSSSIGATMRQNSPKTIQQQQQRRISNTINSPKRNINNDDKRNLSVLQLTPLWEHIIRTKTLPEQLNPIIMFNEFLERLRDPEWQVRQHALRVLVDVLLVIGQKADTYFHPLIGQLVENLGHPAPTVRKGALDCLRVYLSETAMPESILLEILDIGLNQRITNEPFGGRLTCGVMLSLPSLVQATLQTPKRNFILQSTIDLLVSKMTQITHQEITLKVLLKLKELLGVREFMEYMSAGAYREFELLCNVYGIGDYEKQKPDMKSWKLVPSFDSDEAFTFSNTDAYWRPTDDDDLDKAIDMSINNYVAQQLEQHCPHQTESEGKVIMETEIKINDDTLTMRILEAKDDFSQPSDENLSSSEDEKNNNNQVVFVHPFSPHHHHHHSQSNINNHDMGNIGENSGFVQVLTDSEVEEINQNVANNLDYNIPRTPKRVTFGGEVVKMRTPDSDTIVPSDADSEQSSKSSIKTNENERRNSINDTSRIDKLNFLTVDIPNDNTKPVSVIQQSLSSRPKSAQTPKKQQNLKSSPLSSDPSSISSPISPLRRKLSLDDIRQKSGSPKSPFRRISVSPVDDIVSPKPIHKEIEVLHNLQREISPIRPKQRPQSKTEHNSDIEELQEGSVNKQKLMNENYTMPAKTWEELGIVKPEVLKDLKSGDWRYRSHAICSIEEALKSSDNLALVQPNLDSLLRTLLSSEKNSDVTEDKRRVLMNLISRLPLDNLENRTVQIITGLCRQGGPGSNRVSKTLMQRLPPAVIVLKLLSDEFLHARSSRFRENALQMVMYALMTFPSTCFDTSTCVTRATYAALDKKKRVRQAALDVLAILGQVTSPRIVMEIVQHINDSNNISNTYNINSENLLSAVKARLSRKQLPNISSDGFIQYALRLPSPQTIDPNTMADLGADIEWIVSGIGSVSPTSVKRRKNQQQQQQQQHSINTSCPHNGASDLNRNKSENSNRRLKPPHEVLAYGVGVKQFDESDENKIHQYHMTNGGMQINQMKFNQDNSNSSSGGEQQIGINGKRIPTYIKNNKSLNKSCSDSSLNGRRNLDSKKFNIKDGRAQIRHSVTSRFPAMERLDVTGTSIERQSYRNPYEVVLTNGNRLNVAYQRPSYSIYRKGARNINYNEVFENGNYESGSDSKIGDINGGNQNPKRFMNVDKFIMQSNKPHQQHIYTTDHQNNYDDRQYHHSPHENGEYNRNNEKHSRTSCFESRFIPPSNVQSITKIDSFNQLPSVKTTDPLLINNKTREESSELSSSEERFTSSGHSTPTQQIGPLSSKSTPTNKIQSRPTSSFEPTGMATAVTILSRTPSIQSNLISNEIENKLSRPESPLSIKSLDIQEDIKVANEGTDQTDNVKRKVDNVENYDSLEIVEDIEDVNKAEDIQPENIDYSKVDEIEQESIETVIVTTPKEEDMKNITESKERDLKSENPSTDVEQLDIEVIEPLVSKPVTFIRSPSPIPTVEVKPISRQSSTLAKSYDSIYETTSPIRQDLDIRSTASTVSSSDYPPSVAASLDCPLSKSITNFQTADKPPHIPLMRKSKTTLFGSRHRRVSPAKQSMLKINKTELFPQTLGKFDKPKDGLNLAVQQLESSNWEIVMTGIVSMVRLMRFHPEYLDAHIHVACMQLAKTVKNLRSQVARAACQASTEFFSVRNKYLEQECDDLVGNLLNRTADTNRFIRADATRALESMCDNLTPPKILHLLTTRGALHQNAVVRTATAKLMNRLVDRLGCERVFSMNRENREKVFLTCANLLLEGSLETRNYAKTLFRTLCEHPNYNRSILEFVPSRTYRNIEKTLKSIR